MSTIDARQDLERIRQTRDGDADDVRDETEPVILTCPIEGCSRTTIDDPSGLRSHVRQAGDDAHRFRTLNEELELEFDEEAYHAAWGPGIWEDTDEQESICDDYEGIWGPGVPVEVS